MAPALLAASALASSPLPAATFAEFEEVLSSHDSATAALEQWCEQKRIAEPARVTAENIATDATAPPKDLPSRLAIGPDVSIARRNVRLRCGGTLLSVAWNWYLPSRLTPAMNAALHGTDTPFGKVAAPLKFRRQPLGTVAGRAEICPAGTISTHTALLVLPDDRPLAYVIECYTAANLVPTGKPGANP